MSNNILKRNIVVNADNEFDFSGRTFIIPESNKKYKVLKKYNEVDEYENESFMEYVSVGLGANLSLKFYDENDDEVHGVVLKNKKKDV